MTGNEVSQPEGAAQTTPSPVLDRATLDGVLGLQLLVAWAGEGRTDPPRLGFWRTAFCDELGGEDLMRRLAPHTFRWAVLEGARLAAKRVDERVRGRTADADQLVSLFRFGFAIDERLDDHLAALKRRGDSPEAVLPSLALIKGGWNREAFSRFLTDLPQADYVMSASGRRLKGAPPTSVLEIARTLTAALNPLSDTYPAPHYRTGR